MGLGRGDHVPQAGKGIHVEGQVVQLPLEIGQRRVDKLVEGNVASHVVPHFLVGGVENVGPIPVHLNALHRFAMGVAPQMRPPVNDQTAFSGSGHLLREHRAV